MTEIVIQNNGCGVQSTAIYLMAMAGDLHLDYSIFADTGEEPEAVYRHLEWLQSLDGPHIITCSIGRLGEDLKHGRNSSGQRFASIPAYTTDGDNVGVTRRQCTREYKVRVVEETIKRKILLLKPRARVPKSVRVNQVFGISYDERIRAENIKRRFEALYWATPHFPLIDLRMTRLDCEDYNRSRVPHEAPRSACVFCPYKRAGEWLKTKENPKDWERAIEIDTALRTPGNIVNRGLNQQLFLHKSCKPITEIDFEEEAEKDKQRIAMPLFEFDDCGEGMCGI